MCCSQEGDGGGGGGGGKLQDDASGTSVASCSVGHKGENRMKQEKEPSKTQGSHGLGKN